MGGEPADAGRARPVLEQICRRVMHAGPVGSGELLKLAVNLPLMVYWQALGEQLALCQSLKIDPAELMDFLSDTSGAATVLKQRMPNIIARLKNAPPAANFTFSIDGGIKDVKAMLAEAQSRGIELPLLRGGQGDADRQRRGLQRCGLLAHAQGALTPRPIKRRPRFQSRSGPDEAVFLLAVACDLSRAHRAEPQGTHPGGGDRRQPDEGPAARGGLSQGQSDDGASRTRGRRRPGAVRVAGDP
jgi:hypothetical protein